jgi:hypothetical protein
VAACLAAVVAVAVVAVLALRGGGPADQLVRLAPPDALAWAHVTTRGGDDERRLWELAQRFPTLRDLPARLATGFGLSASELDLDRDVRPWLGDEAGIAIVDAAGRPLPLLLAAVRDRSAAVAALRRLGGRPAGGGLYDLPAPGAVAGLGDGVLVAGPSGAVRTALARAGGHGAPGLDRAVPYRHAIEARGDDRVLDVYARAAGVQRLLDARSALIRAAGALLNGAALEAVAADATPTDDGVRIHARVLRTGAAAPSATFAPALLGRVPIEATAALVDLPGGDALSALTARLGGSALLAGARAVLSEQSGVDLDRDLLGPLRGEAALSLQARGAVPVLTLTAHSATPATTREALARIQEPLADRLTGGATSVFQSRDDGSFTLPVTTRLQPSYAVDGNVLVASTAQPGLDQRRVAARGIAQAPALAKALKMVDGDVQALVFFDLHQLLLLAERTGLAAGSAYQAVRSDLDPVRAAAGVVRQEPDHPTDTTAELFLEIP